MKICLNEWLESHSRVNVTKFSSPSLQQNVTRVDSSPSFDSDSPIPGHISRLPTNVCNKLTWLILCHIHSRFRILALSNNRTQKSYLQWSAFKKWVDLRIQIHGIRNFVIIWNNFQIEWRRYTTTTDHSMILQSAAKNDIFF
jgi:hypothetical protein